jgi:hypothetical protein
MTESFKIDIFNKIMMDMVNFLEKELGNIPVINNYKGKLLLVTSIYPDKPYNFFQIYVYPCKTQIMKCDETFFKIYLKENMGHKQNYIGDFYEIWENEKTTLVIKAKIFQYFQKLIKIIDK